MSPDRLLAWMRGHRAAPGPALCVEGCGRPTFGGDGSPRCHPCLLRALDLAAHPERFPRAVVEAAAAAHADVVGIGCAVTASHMVISQTGLSVCSHLRPAFIWTDPAWPVDDGTTLADGGAAVARLERLWGVP